MTVGAVTDEHSTGSRILAPSATGLSRRESEALRLVAAGATDSEISEKLGIGEQSVETLLIRTFAKLGAQGRAEAVAVAHDLGLL